MTRKPPLPADVEADQLWRAPGGQHYKVFTVHNGIATLNRATREGRVLNTRYQFASRSRECKARADPALF